MALAPKNDIKPLAFSITGGSSSIFFGGAEVEALEVAVDFATFRGMMGGATGGALA